MRVTTEDDIKTIRQMASEGMCQSAVAVSLGMKHASVRYHAQKHGIKFQMGRRKWVRPDFVPTKTPSQARRAIEYFNQHRVRVIHAELDMPPGPKGMFHFGNTGLLASADDLVRWAG